MPATSIQGERTMCEPGQEMVDGFTYEEIERMVFDSVVTARCDECGDYCEVEPDARNYTCHSCGAPKAVTSPLVKLRII